MKKKKLVKIRPLVRIVRKKGKTVFERTDYGQFFYDLVMGRQTARKLAEKWDLTADKITELRRLGRRTLRQTRPHVQPLKNMIRRGAGHSTKKNWEQIRRPRHA